MGTFSHVTSVESLDDPEVITLPEEGGANHLEPFIESVPNITGDMNSFDDLKRKCWSKMLSPAKQRVSILACGQLQI